MEIRDLKKYWNLDFLFPGILLYVCCPLVFILDRGLKLSTWEFFRAAGMLSVWWVVLFYDGTFRGAGKWIWRFFKYHAPAILLYYLLAVLGLLDFWAFLIGLPVLVVSNLFWGVVCYWLRRVFGSAKAVFVVLLLFVLVTHFSYDSLFGSAFAAYVPKYIL